MKHRWGKRKKNLKKKSVKETEEMNMIEVSHNTVMLTMRTQLKFMRIIAKLMIFFLLSVILYTSLLCEANEMKKKMVPTMLWKILYSLSRKMLNFMKCNRWKKEVSNHFMSSKKKFGNDFTYGNEFRLTKFLGEMKNETI